MKYLITYGETMPVWKKEFLTWKEVDEFVRKHLHFGDIIFKIELIGE